MLQGLASDARVLQEILTAPRNLSARTSQVGGGHRGVHALLRDRPAEREGARPVGSRLARPAHDFDEIHTTISQETLSKRESP